MGLWDAYQRLQPLERITIVFAITVIFVIGVSRMDKLVKQRQWLKPGDTTEKSDTRPLLYANIELNAKGVLVAYISYWRYLIFSVFFAVGFYISLQALIYFYQDLPTGFWKNWDKAATLTFVCFVFVLAMPVMLFRFLKSNYKKVQLEIHNDHVRFLKSAVRGGTLLSDYYMDIPYKEILSVGFRHNPLGSGMIDVATSYQTHVILLLLSVNEQLTCYRALEEAINAWREKRK